MNKHHKPTVLWLIKGLGAGGAERLLSDSIPYLDRRTFNYEVAYMLPWKRDFVPDFERAGIPAHCLNSTKRVDPGVFLRLRRLLRERHVTLLHSHLPSTGITARFASRMTGVRARIYTEHNVLGVYHPAIRFLDRLTYRMDDITIAVSEEVANTARGWRLLRPGRLNVIENGVAMSGIKVPDDGAPRPLMASLGVPAGNFIIGNIAHLRPAKGHNFLLDAVKLIAASHPAVTCVIVGREKTPGVQAELERYATSLGIRDHVVFTGFREDARELAAETDAFVLSSLFEGLPIALLESMALRKPVVVTAVGGVPEVVTDGVHGFLVPPKDPAALAGGVLRLIADPSLRRRMGEAGAEKVLEDHSTKRMVRQIEQLYHEVLTKRGLKLGRSSAGAPSDGMASGSPAGLSNETAH
jgi:glycosyltransferase involved in cell wall biosynthesis